MYVGHTCNVSCNYCPQGTPEEKSSRWEHPKGMQYLWMDDVKNMINLAPKGSINGISYSGGEPLLFLPKIMEMASFLTREHPEIYQWIYTNGLLITEDILKMLYHDLMIREIRVHLGATNFNPKVMWNLKAACRIMQYANVETPSTPETKRQLLDLGKIHELEEMGVYQLNLAEMYFTTDQAVKTYGNTDLYEYTSRMRGRSVSPMYSRMITYDIMEYVCKHNINILVNDCSNESRDVQQFRRYMNPLRLPEMY